MDNSKKQLLRKITLSPKRKLEKIIQVLSAYLPQSLIPQYPSEIIIDPVNICNLKCPLCPTGLKKLNYEPMLMSFKTFKIIVDKIPGLNHICLFNWGEPFLNPSLFKMIRHAHEKDIRVLIHSNFSFKKDNTFFSDIINSKLDSLVLSLDGVTQQSYSKYRIGGDFELVLSNLKKLTKMRNEMRSSTPHITWKFIVNRFNENEVAEAKKKAHGLGVKFETSFLGLSDDLPDFDFQETLEQRMEYWLPIKKKYQHPYYRNKYKTPLNNAYCRELFQRMVVNPDGKVSPCCWSTSKENVFGDLTKDSLEEIWDNLIYQYSRSLFIKEKYSGAVEKTVCSTCINFQKVNNI